MLLPNYRLFPPLDEGGKEKAKSAEEEEEDHQQPFVDSDGLIPSHATLVIAPLTLIEQWRQELEKCAGGLLSVTTYPKDEADRISTSRRGGTTHGKDSRLKRINLLARRGDVVIATYRTLAKERSNKVLLKIRWRRVVLDEMQEVRSSTTELARSCAKLKAAFRWMVSGTPFYTSINDLNGELNFLGVQPFCLNDRVDGFWGRRIAVPWADKDVRARDLLDVLLEGVMIRHSKSQTTIIHNRSILELPPFQFDSRPVIATCVCVCVCVCVCDVYHRNG
eukprot:jgi/Bigna1/43693/e_gw1.82.87.1